MSNNYGSRPNNSERTEEKLGPFFDAKGNLDLEWVGTKAKNLSQDINTRELKGTALRNFYNEFLRIKNLPQAYNDEKKILIRLLISKAHYKKTTAKIPPRFVSFIESLIKEVGEDLDRFDKACLVMEAIVGYFPKNN